MSIRAIVAACAALLTLSCTGAGPRNTLPESKQDFAKVVGAWIKTGDGIVESMDYLESQDFQCAEHVTNATTICQRSDGGGFSPLVVRSYVIALSGTDGVVEAVESDIWLTGL